MHTKVRSKWEVSPACFCARSASGGNHDGHFSVGEAAVEYLATRVGENMDATGTDEMEGPEVHLHDALHGESLAL